MIYGSLFSGIGGIDLGFDRAGMTCAWQVEKDDFCRRVLTKHWPDVPKYEDVYECGKQNLSAVDVITGGFPCQPVSVAGLGLAKNDDRWLWPEFARIIGELRPKYTLMENVPGIINRGLSDVIGDLSKIGYDAEWQTLPAVAFGSPHLRYRTFILAYPIGKFGNSGAYANTRFNKTWRSSRVGEFGRMGSTETYVEAISDYARRDDGIPDWVDRLRALGNAVVPQVAEFIGRLIMAAEYGESGE